MLVLDFSDFLHGARGHQIHESDRARLFGEKSYAIFGRKVFLVSFKKLPLIFDFKWKTWNIS